MLRHLTIKDFVIVDRLELAFASGFGALTGETGAGKSILIDALALALGERADAGVVRSGCDKAEVAASFDVAALPQVGDWLAANDLDGDDELLLRRVVDAGGRSRAYINGSPATVQQLREVGEWLVDIHGQHAHQSLLRSDAQRSLLDAHAGLGEAVRAVGAAWKTWRDAAQMLRDASQGAEALQRERDQLQWQIGELEALVGRGAAALHGLGVGAGDVQIEIRHCGVCHSDIHQAQLDRASRQRQLQGSFMVAPAARLALQGLHLALVDDVMTSGATLTEVANALQRAGARRVDAWVLARTPAPDR